MHKKNIHREEIRRTAILLLYKPRMACLSGYCSSFVCFPSSKPISKMAATSVKAEAIAIEKSGVKIVRNPPESKLTELGVRSWPK